MSDPRLNGNHLGATRHERYDAAIDAMLDARGPVTGVADPLARPSATPPRPIRQQVPPPGGTRTLVCLLDGRRHPLRVGINTIGRFSENDLVLEPNSISRRHCVVLVHATGGCEVCDTASRNGTCVNHRRITRTALFPGDELMLCAQKFLVAWVGSNGELFHSAEGAETDCLSGLSQIG